MSERRDLGDETNEAVRPPNEGEPNPSVEDDTEGHGARTPFSEDDVEGHSYPLRRPNGPPPAP